MEGPTTARARARAELISEIKVAARAQLASEGAAALSLRAVAREIGMVSSAVYRYFPSRDDLLTALIIDAYNTLGERVEQHEAKVRRTDFRGRWLASAHALRDWSCENPHEYGLVYGTPVPRYAAPVDTIDPASRPTKVLAVIVVDAVAAGVLVTERETIPRAVKADLVELKPFFGPTVSDEVVLRALMAWTHVFGAISFELFGHRVGSVTNHDAFFDLEMQRMAAFVGL